MPSASSTMYENQVGASHWRNRLKAIYRSTCRLMDLYCDDFMISCETGLEQPCRLSTAYVFLQCNCTVWGQKCWVKECQRCRCRCTLTELLDWLQCSFLFFYFFFWGMIQQNAEGDDRSCTLLHQQPRAAKNRRQTPESGDSLFALQLLRHKHFFLFECFMKRVAHIIWKRQKCMYLSGMTTFLFNLSDGGIAHGPEAHKEAERSASLRPAGIKAAEIATRWWVCT